VVAGLAIPRFLILAVAAVAVWMVGSGLVIPFFNIWFQRAHGLAIARIGAIFAGAQAVTALVVFASGEAASRIGPGRVLLAWTLLMPPVLWLLVPAEGLALAIALFAVQGFVAPATNPLIDQLLLERAPRGRQGAVSSWRNAATELSGLAGAAGGGFMLERASFALLFSVAGAFAAAGAAGLALVFRGARGSSADQRASPEADAGTRIETLPRATS
jgi:predicted MFS family arabinose efflux permease